MPRDKSITLQQLMELGEQTRKEVGGIPKPTTGRENWPGLPIEQAEDIKRKTVYFGWGDFWTRPQLDLKTRRLITLVALTWTGTERYLRSHIKGALAQGITPEEITEVLEHMMIYCGYPRALTALGVASDVFVELGVGGAAPDVVAASQIRDMETTLQAVYDLGQQVRQTAGNTDRIEGHDEWPGLPPEVADDIKDKTVYTGMGDWWSRPHLDLKTRRLITLAALAWTGREKYLRGHIRGAIQQGITPEEISEVFNHMMIYIGFPHALTAVGIASDVFREMEVAGAASS